MSHPTQACWKWLVLVVSALISGGSTAAQNFPGLGPEPPVAGPPRFEDALPPSAPDWVPLEPNAQKYVDDVLAYWEQRSGKITRYECRFQRWEYDSVFGPKAPDKYFSYSTGQIRYVRPDKGLFKVTETWEFSRQKEDYQKKQVEFDDYWVCDGKSVFQFKAAQKQVIETVLPADIQGKSIVDGPLPFLFGAEAERIKSRYWVRAVTPPGKKNEYHLEAVPKTRADASNFKKALIILDAEDYLPKALTIYALSFNPDAPDPNFARTTLEFKERKVNHQDFAEKVNPLFKDPFKVTVPSGWEKVVQQMAPAPAAQPAPRQPPPPANPAPRAQQAVRPIGPLPPRR